MFRQVGQTPGQGTLLHFVRAKPLCLAEYPAAQQGPVILETRSLGLETCAKFIVTRQRNPLPSLGGAINCREHTSELIAVIYINVKRYRPTVSSEQQSRTVIAIKKRTARMD